MFQGQPKRPKYAVGDVVHLVNNEASIKHGPVTRSSSAGGVSVHHSQLQPSLLDNFGSSNISESTAYRVSALHTSSTDQQPHRYELTPLEPLKVTATEANIIPAQFLPGDIVTPIASAAATEDYYRVKTITIKEDGALLTSKIGYGATPSRPARDDGEYEILENPFAGGFHATRQREAAGTNLGGAKRTSLSKAKLEERVRIVLSLVDGCGHQVEMDAKKVRKVAAGEEWKFVELEKFMGQN